MVQPEHAESDGLIARASGGGAREKVYYLERYLEIFSVGMKARWGGRLYYLDLFAGPGKCRIRDTGEEIDGSETIPTVCFSCTLPSPYTFFRLRYNALSNSHP
jgi:hypothetical protein